MASHNQEPLDVLIQRITNPLSQTYDPQLVYTFCERIKRDQDGAVAATRLLAYRVQSPQEREAMLALDLLDTCARTGGARFQAELGKFRFLNELIKLLSPRYLGARTPQRVKQRVADLLLLWSRQIPHETKIQEAFTLLQKQGLLDLHGIAPRDAGGAAARMDDALMVPESADEALDPHRAPTPPLPSTERPKNPIFEDSQKAALLKRLLQSTNPDDIQAANRLIKTMVKQDEERSERVSRRVTELETVHSNLRLLEEMMDNYSPETTSSEEMELMAELCTSCQQLRGKLDTLAAETDDQDSALAELVSASEQIGATIARHRELSSRSAPLTLLQLESPQEVRPPEAPDRGHSQDMLQKQLERLGLSDAAASGPSSIPTALSVNQPPDLLGRATGPPPSVPTTAAPVPAPAGSGLAELLGALDCPPASAPQPHPPPPGGVGVGMSHQTMLAQMLPPARTAAPTVPRPSQPPARSPFDDLDDLVRLSMSSSAPGATATAASGSATADRLLSAPPGSPSTNRTAASAGSPRPSAVPTNHTPPQSPGRAAGAEPNGHQPITDLLGDDVSLLSTLSGPSSHDSLLSETGLGGQMGSIGSQPMSAGGHPASAGGQPGSGRGQDPAAGDAASRPPGLSEVTVRLEDITPGGAAPVPLFCEPNSLEISLHGPAGNRPRRDVTVYIITTLNRTGRPVTQYTLQAVCDKSARVRLQAPSTTDLPAGSPFLPPPAASQVLLLARPEPQMSVHLRFMLSYSMDDDIITEMAETTLTGQS
ncbi:ADP-ribosylation factor-binding protein GGA2-like isoform X1 [Amphibalanus amphitrite]|uniref:ADP-ribosylation factor-binding protein GGA2-like isoform X1 n=1 Tax=Amphibalanus amphitrite TaxID=1232801 RepID=UPI001C90D342|nr:ADP-ribosylation factor-binding protein GGA2-like isoform X1 [Amphibalanus amphitrite]XP_043190487.1 ADP-ribosylation factor-binding protein GGA2-like isoform X1 [Amphibalanus amphitrite]